MIKRLKRYWLSKELTWYQKIFPWAISYRYLKEKTKKVR